MALAENYRAPLTDISFAQSLIERPLTEHDDPQLIDRALADPKTHVMMLSEQGAACKDDALYLTPGPDFRAGSAERLVYLGSYQGTAYILAVVDGAQRAAGPYRWMSLREAFLVLNPLQSELFVEAQAIANWIRSEKFCPRCGSPVRPATFGWAQRCEQNDHELFPRTDPAIIAAVIDDQDRILLGSNANFRNNMYSVLAGFVEAGESLESAVRREIFEESGVRIGEVAYRGSQPWPLPRSLMLGFTAQALSTDLVPDGAEIKDLRWFTREQLAADLTAGTLDIPRGVSISHALIRSWFGADLPEAAK